MMSRLINWEFTREKMKQRMGSQRGETIKLDTRYSLMVRKLNIKTKLNILFKENGHWLIGEKYQNVGGFKSVRTDLDDVPTEGWLYNDRTKWNDNDTTITVTGEGGRGSVSQSV